MILDQLDNFARYECLGPRFVRAFHFLKTLDLARPDGRCEIEGDAVYATLMSYGTKIPVDATHEVHRVYADVQFLIAGQETMYFTPANRLGPGGGYNGEKDFELCAKPLAPTTLLVHAGQFAVFFPGEGHKPGLASLASEPVRKAVVKIRI
jgi:YhcH/YjgK/YiaL family protein